MFRLGHGFGEFSAWKVQTKGAWYNAHELLTYYVVNAITYECHSLLYQAVAAAISIFVSSSGKTLDGVFHNLQTHSLESPSSIWFLRYVSSYFKVAIVNVNNDPAVAVEGVLSFGAKKEAKRFAIGRKDTDQLASFRILASMSNNDPLCVEVFQQCYPSHKKPATKSTSKTNRQSKDYIAQNESPLENSILWIRACLIERKLSEIIQVFINNAQ